MKKKTVILFDALALSAGAFADPAQQDKLVYKFLDKGIDNPFLTGTRDCHLNRVYHADYDPLANSGSQGDPLNPSISDYPPYELIFTFDKFVDIHNDHGDIVTVQGTAVPGASPDKLNAHGLAVGINTMIFDDTCAIDQCTIDRQEL